MKQHVLPCLRGVMGDWVYYATVMSAEQIAARILPSKNIREEKSLEDFLQRRLRDRVKKIEKYLATTNSRFFGAIIVGVFDAVPDWYEFDLRSVRDKYADISPGDLATIHESIGLLQLTGQEKMFAIDGQHRVAAITNLWRSSDSGSHLADDQFPVVLVAHIDDALGKKRTRRLFSDINKRAVPVSKGDLAVIDEEDVAAIVARRLYAEYPHFKRGKLISLTEVAQLASGDTEHFTNLLTLVKVAGRLKPLYRKKPRTKEYEEPNVLSLQNVVTEFLNFSIQHFVPLHRYFVSKTVSLKKSRQDKQNLLFRPVGLVVIATVYRNLARSDALKVLQRHAKALDFSPEGHLAGLMWDAKGSIQPKHTSIAVSLILHLLGKLDGSGRKELADKYEVATKGTRVLPKLLGGG